LPKIFTGHGKNQFTAWFFIQWLVPQSRKNLVHSLEFALMRIAAVGLIGYSYGVTDRDLIGYSGWDAERRFARSTYPE
jgi:lipid-A-disaccharide synthase-like uncharacterized protein